MKLKKISIVIPTRNEEGNIESLVTEINKSLWKIPHEIVFVDDSTDATWECINRVAARQSEYNVTGEHRENGNGLAGAVIRGFELASGDYIAVMDADFQHPPGLLREMYCAMRRGADICIPSRFISGGSDGGLGPWRKLVSSAARYIGKIFLPCLRKISDPTGGVYMFRKELLDDVTLRPVGWKIMIEMLASCKYGKIIEIPYSFGKRTAGASKLDANVTVQYIRQVFSLKSGCTYNRVKVIRWTKERLNKEVDSLDVQLMD